LTNVISLILLGIISLHYKVPQKLLNRLGITKIEITPKTYLGYRINTIESLVYNRKGFGIVMLGDSLTARADWNILLNRDDAANFGIGGDTTEGVIHRLSDIYLLNPRKCFLMIGINDIFGGADVDDVFENYKTIITAIKGHGIEVVVESTLHISSKASKIAWGGKRWKRINAKVNALNGLLKAYCDSGNITYLDINKELSTDGVLDNQYTSEWVHLLHNAYEKWRDIIAPFL
jgi:lysophospholipase L1-like esterase